MSTSYKKNNNSPQEIEREEEEIVTVHHHHHHHHHHYIHLKVGIKSRIVMLSNQSVLHNKAVSSIAYLVIQPNQYFTTCNIITIMCT